MQVLSALPGVEIPITTATNSCLSTKLFKMAKCIHTIDDSTVTVPTDQVFRYKTSLDNKLDSMSSIKLDHIYQIDPHIKLGHASNWAIHQIGLSAKKSPCIKLGHA